jgi:tetratricopeptide (TPR) repeat protein
MNRREFFAAVAVVTSLPVDATADSTTSPKVFPHVDVESDEFACEKAAAHIEGALSQLLARCTLPLAPGFRGVSPLPISYKTVAENVQQAVFDRANPNFADGLRAWIASLGKVVRSNFYALPDDVVRYEITGVGEHRVGLWKQVWRDGALAEFAPIEETRVSLAQPLFADVTTHCLGATPAYREQLSKGNTWWRARMDIAAGMDLYGSNGVAVGDIDNDGRDEIYVCQQGGLPNRLFKPRADGTFEDITEASGLGILDDTTCALFLDLRNSGKQDAVVLRGSGPLLFLNDGHGRFTHQPDAFRFQSAPQGSFTGMSAADYDRDGHVDLYLCCYVYFQSEDQYRYPAPYHDAQNGPPNFLFRNRLNSDGFFEDVTAATGMNHNNDRFSFAPAWCDLDGDGWPDLYVANDFGRNNLYRNRAGKFRDEAAAAGVEDMGPGMSATWADYDGDGRPDLYISNMWSAPGQRIVRDPAFAPSKELPEAYRRHTKGNSLYRNRGDGTFAETGAPEGVEMGRWAWSSDAFDFDNDGTPEIYVTCGMLSHPKSKQDLRSYFWRQVVAKSPTTAKAAPDYEEGWNSINQLIREDYSWCGVDPNVFYVRPKPVPGQEPRYYDFSGVSGLDFADDSRTFAAVDFDGDGNLDMVLKSRQGPQVRALRNQGGAGKRVLVLTLRGVKSNADAIGARVEVNGRTQWVKAGSGYLSQHTRNLHFALGDAEQGSAKIVWPSGLTQEVAGLKAGFRHEIREGSDQVASLRFSARVPMPAGEPRAENMPSFADTWLLEPVPLPDRRQGPGFLLLSNETKPILPGGVPIQAIQPAPYYDVFRRYLFEYRTGLNLPLLLLIDGQSRVRKIYPAMPSEAVLRADLSASPNALPFPGRYYQEPHRSYFKLGAAFYNAGYPEQAVPYLEEVVRRDPSNWKSWNAIARIQLDAGRPRPALENFERTLRLRPNHGAALVGAGEAYAKLENTAEAERMFRRAIAENEKDSDAWNQLGVLFGQSGNLKEARQAFQNAIVAHRDHAGALNNLAVLYVRLGQANDAVAAFRFGIEQAPDDKTLYVNLGRLYVSLNEREKARGVMQRWLARNPGDAGVEKALQELDSR